MNQMRLEFAEPKQVLDEFVALAGDKNSPDYTGCHTGNSKYVRALSLYLLHSVSTQTLVRLLKEEIEYLERFVEKPEADSN